MLRINREGTLKRGSFTDEDSHHIKSVDPFFDLWMLSEISCDSTCAARQALQYVTQLNSDSPNTEITYRVMLIVPVILGDFSRANLRIIKN
jgi:hypothetical protein